MKLIEPTMEYDREIQAFRNEFLHPGMSMDGGGSLIRCENTADWLTRVEAFKRQETVPEGRVPTMQFIYLREEDRKIVGVIQIRHHLNEAHLKWFGHIGYSVAPSERHKGYATQMLGLVLPECRRLGIPKVLITCIRGNEGSKRTILKNGGVYESTVYQQELERYLERYWINLS